MKDPSGKATGSEIKLAIANQLSASLVYINSAVAKDRAEREYEGKELEGDRGDAFRHAYWSAMNARDVGPELAKAFGEAHENFPTNNEADRNMDLHNNAVGIEIAKAHPDATDEQLVSYIKLAMLGGKLQLQRSSNDSAKNGTPYPEDQTYDGKVNTTDKLIQEEKRKPITP